MAGLLLETLAGVPVGKALTSTDEVDNFVAIAWSDLRGVPLFPGQDFKIALDGHALGADSQMREQPGDIEAAGDLVCFSIHSDIQGCAHGICAFS